MICLCEAFVHSAGVLVNVAMPSWLVTFLLILLLVYPQPESHVQRALAVPNGAAG